VEESLIRVALQLLDHVRADMNAALAAPFSADFRQGNAPVAFGNTIVVVD
jgi:hypothetical protein